MSNQPGHPQTESESNNTMNLSAKVDGGPRGRGLANGATADSQASNLDIHNEPHDDHPNDLRHDLEDSINADSDTLSTAGNFNPQNGIDQDQQETFVPERQGQAQQGSGEASSTRTEGPSAAPKRFKRVRPLCKIASTELTKCRSIARYQPSNPPLRR